MGSEAGGEHADRLIIDLVSCLMWYPESPRYRREPPQSCRPPTLITASRNVKGYSAQPVRNPSLRLDPFNIAQGQPPGASSVYNEPFRNTGVLMKCCLRSFVVSCLLPTLAYAQFDDANWNIVYQETFDSDFVAVDQQTFGTDDWLMFQLINGGAITVANGYAQLTAEDFWNAALIRSVHSLPAEYKVRTKIGFINYDLTNYEQADYDHPDFNSHGGYYENGVYFLTVTDDTCSGYECAEEWWHYHRKMVIDIDNHIDYGGGSETFHPIYMVYMAPETNILGNLLRTWDGSAWDESAWNWNVAATYDYDKWYYAELEKRNGNLTLRLYDEDQNIIEETTPVSLTGVNAMDNPVEYLYVGEPHTDDYEGNARIDEITLFSYDSMAVDVVEAASNLPASVSISQNYPNPFNPSTTIEYSLPRPTDVRIDVFNLLGQKVATLVEARQAPGSYRTVWDGKDSNGRTVSSGIYFYTIAADNREGSRSMLLLK